jgi:uncharacterized protein
MAKMNDQVQETINTVKPALVATADASGKPNVSAKGSLRTIDDEHIAFADVKSPRTIANIKENNKISIIVLGNEEQKGYRIWGTAVVKDSGDVFDTFAKAMAEKNMTVNNVVVIEVEEIEV